eukprot:TRINITY_DN13180_c1_g2_i1.p5 TRINITY_DN13180_c1_g2~~TRINITY_DN13180_c1_g2_i1.p5  ORF type:complete len:116 (+),score=1.33 TRINITY_DN13180_c1_g2_i1:200-547(+)
MQVTKKRKPILHSPTTTKYIIIYTLFYPTSKRQNIWKIQTLKNILQLQHIINTMKNNYIFEIIRYINNITFKKNYALKQQILKNKYNSERRKQIESPQDYFQNIYKLIEHQINYF